MQAVAADFSGYAGKIRCFLARNEHLALWLSRDFCELGLLTLQHAELIQESLQVP